MGLGFRVGYPYPNFCLYAFLGALTPIPSTPKPPPDKHPKRLYRKLQHPEHHDLKPPKP